MDLDRTRIAALSSVTTATLTTLLLKKGLRNVWMRGTRPVRPGGEERVVGHAFTLRFIPAREDQATPESWAKPTSTRGAIEAMPAGCIAVVDARGVVDAGIFGDILCARMRKRGVAALVTDGVVRRNASVRVIRDGAVIYTTTIAQLKRFKDDVREVAEGFECGILLDGFNDVKEGDVLEVYETREVERTDLDTPAAAPPAADDE
jgi:regulator of RNase E activity RraA